MELGKWPGKCKVLPDSIQRWHVTTAHCLFISKIKKKKRKETSDNYLMLTEKISVFLQPYVGAKSIDVLKYKIILNI